ncbi:Mut7-C ubiquitin/RNAse domain-containing protein [Sphaerisporangium perillae]|uniref:Mut7-C ubiquitin/RNAse domain-containing protein n=1 Tax=Sphaerisporangium perillae TaxID=2935860 RepID=UPI00200E92F2|nr:Mut7-C ubiquitin/RNAse domain-containing protein [Sphaerisporangium perillae]
MLGLVGEQGLCLLVERGLWVFLAPRHRRDEVRVTCDGTSSLGHVVESVGVPLPEVGRLVVDGRAVSPSYRPAAGDVVRVLAVRRPQPVPSHRFLLDVHLGTLARRLRLVGVDAAYDNDLDDDTLIAWANAERRVLLTRDRGLLRRRSLWLGAHVRGSRPEEQFLDVLTRFAPPLAPWTRCTACNGALAPVGKDEVERSLRPGTRRSYDAFARCLACGRVYWRGAHGPHLEAIVAEAESAVAVSAAGSR